MSILIDHIANTIQSDTGNVSLYFSGTSITIVGASTTTFASTVTITSNAGANSTTTGALQVTGGVGIGGGLFVGGAITATTLTLTTGTIALGLQAALTTQGANAIAIGYQAGYSQGSYSIAIGSGAAGNAQGSGSIAIGNGASATQGNGSVSVGANTGYLGVFGTIIGANGGSGSTIPDNATLIGANVASNATLNAGTYITPIRADATTSATQFVVYYNPKTQEITTSTPAAASVFNTATAVAYAVTATYASIAYSLAGGSSFNTATAVAYAVTASNASTAYTLANTSSFLVGYALNAAQATTATSAATAYSTIASLTAGTGLSGTAFNGSTAVTWTVNTATAVAYAVTATFASIAYSVATLTNALIINNTTLSTSTNTGALQVTGGVGVGGSLFVGGAFTSTGNITISSPQPEMLFYDTVTGRLGEIGVNNTFDMYINSTNGGGYLLLNAPGNGGGNRVGVNNASPNYTLDVGGTLNASSNLTVGGTGIISSTAASNSTNTGALVVTGGVGIGGSLYVGSTASSVSTTTGALQVSGGVGIGGALNVQDSITAGTTAGTSATISLQGSTYVTIQSAGTALAASIFTTTIASLNIANVATSVNISTGTVVPTLMQFGSTLASSATIQLQGTTGVGIQAGGSAQTAFVFPNVNTVNIGQTTGATGAVKISSGFGATTTATGALQVVGGIGVGGKVFAGSVSISSGTNLSAPLTLASGTTTISAAVGAVEYDGNNLYFTPDTSQLRTAVRTYQQFYLSSTSTALTGATQNFFGATSAATLAAYSTYDIECFCYFLKTTAGTVQWVPTFSTLIAMGHDYYDLTAVTGFTTGISTTALSNAAATQQGTLTLANLASASLTTLTYHIHKHRIKVVTSSTCNFRLNVSISAGTITPQAGSYYTVRKVVSNAGNFVA